MARVLGYDPQLPHRASVLTWPPSGARGKQAAGRALGNQGSGAFHAQLRVSMKTGTAVRRAIDTEVASHVFVRENALSAVTSVPSHSRWRGGGRQCRRQTGEVDAQAEAGMGRLQPEDRSTLG